MQASVTYDLQSLNDLCNFVSCYGNKQMSKTDLYQDFITSLCEQWKQPGG